MALLLLFLFVLEPPAHDIQVAFYKIYEDNSTVYVDFMFEKKDILQTLAKDSTGFSNQNVQNYLQENFSLFINDKKQSIDFGNIDIDEKHIHVTGTLADIGQPIQSLEIENNCLLLIKDHSNIIELRLHDEERDFLMNSDRTKIKINY